MEQEYQKQINEAVDEVFTVMANRVNDEEMANLKAAFALAEEAHRPQRRKSGEPYIIHPVKVALIAAKELKLDAASVMAAFLHDVVEDTEYTIKDIERFFGRDVAFLVNVVTKKKKKEYKTSKQVDNYQQLLESLKYDIRALMVKIADRLHNMRTLDSMRPDKQMKIAAETDYFYAPLANRLGLYDVKTDLENLSFRFRCPMESSDIAMALQDDIAANAGRLDQFTTEIGHILHENGIEGRAEVFYRKPYSIWRRMQSQNRDFRHIDHRYYVRITFTDNKMKISEKDVCLRIYSLLTNRFKEQPQTFKNMIDSAKENSYQYVGVKLLSDAGVWEEVQICSHQMVESSKLGCMAQLHAGGNIKDWIERFKGVLHDIVAQGQETNFLEKIATTLYYDDVLVFTPTGQPFILPSGSTVIDLAFEIHTELGMHAKYARINGKLCSVKTELQRGDCVEVGTAADTLPRENWIDFAHTYKAQRALRNYLSSISKDHVQRCPICSPIPGGETIGYREKDGRITVHRRLCPEIIRLSSKHGDSIVAYEMEEDPTQHYPVTVHIRGVDRYHLLIDLIDNITNHLHLSIDSLTTSTLDDIAECQITFFVHSVRELLQAMEHLYTIPGVDEVRQV